MFGELVARKSAILACLLLLIASSECQVNIVSRSTWGAPAVSPKVQTIGNNLEYVVIHHTTTGTCNNLQSCKTTLQNIRTGHIRDKGYDDIAYNFLISSDGTVYEGRGWNKRGAHEIKVNCQSIGISFIGTFTTVNPTNEAVTAAKNLIAMARNNQKISANYKLIGHRDAKATECPGTKFYNDIVKKMDRYYTGSVPTLCG